MVRAAPCTQVPSLCPRGEIQQPRRGLCVLSEGGARVFGMVGDAVLRLRADARGATTTTPGSRRRWGCGVGGTGSGVIV